MQEVSIFKFILYIKHSHTLELIAGFVHFWANYNSICRENTLLPGTHNYHDVIRVNFIVSNINWNELQVELVKEEISLRALQKYSTKEQRHKKLKEEPWWTDLEVSIPDKNSRSRTERVFWRKLPMEMSQR